MPTIIPTFSTQTHPLTTRDASPLSVSLCFSVSLAILAITRPHPFDHRIILRARPTRSPSGSHPADGGQVAISIVNRVRGATAVAVIGAFQVYRTRLAESVGRWMRGVSARHSANTRDTRGALQQRTHGLSADRNADLATVLTVRRTSASYSELRRSRGGGDKAAGSAVRSHRRATAAATIQM